MHTEHSRGFSLIELLVVVSIFAFIAAIGLASYNRGSSQTLLTSLAYDIALSLRQAQAFGLSVREYEIAGQEVGRFDLGYGLHFNGSSDSSYIFFVDADGKKDYDGDLSCSNSNECIDRFILGRGHTISDICATPTGGTKTCGLSDLTIIFVRPDPDAVICSGSSCNYSDASITISSSKGLTRRVIVSLAGQISVAP